MKTEKIAVTRTVEVPGQSNIERKTVVSFRSAESVAEMLELCGANQAKVLDFFNQGRWADLRTKTSNALAGQSNEQKAVNKMVSAFKQLNPALTEEQVRAMVMALPNMQEAAAVTSELLPAEISDTFFDEKKAAKEAAKQDAAEPVSA